MLLKNRVKKLTLFRPLIYSRHPTHSILRLKNKTLPVLPFRSVVRLGSTTQHDGHRIECNTIQAVKNSANKLLMKRCFYNEAVKTADWWIADSHNGLKFHKSGIQDTTQEFAINSDTYPIVAKHIFGSRNNGNTLIKSQEELQDWMEGKTLNNYIFEKFYNYSREYRLHVTEEGCFYTCRKMLKQDTAEDKRWFRNDSNSVWIVEENDQFDKPVNWKSVVEQSVKALKAVGLDVGAVDLRIQSANNSKGERREEPDFIVIEINSAPSFGEITSQKYIEQIPKILRRKYERKN